MKEYIELGPCPADEPCAQVGDHDYVERAHDECERFIKLIRKHLGPELGTARLTIKWNPHDFGNYAEVVCYYDSNDSVGLEYALRAENGAPATWEEEK